MIKDAYGNTRFYGIYRGVVFSTDDPLGKHRIRVKVPQILADSPTQWAWPIGGVSSSVPSVGSGVWVQFEGGDPAYPIWAGVFAEVSSGAGTASAAALTKSDVVSIVSTYGISNLADQTDVSTSNPVTNDFLVYDGTPKKWTNKPLAINGTTIAAGSTNTITASTTAALTFGTYLTAGGSSFNGSTATTISTNATDANTPSTIVARDRFGGFAAAKIFGTDITGTTVTANNYFVSLTTASSDTIPLDFSAGNGLQTRAANTAAITFTGANYVAGSTITVRIQATGSTTSLTFPGSWVFVGSKPTQIAASKSGILTVTSFGTTEANCIASWVAQL